MLKFDIEFSDGIPPRSNYVEAVLYIGDYRETVRSDLSIWSVDDYRIHWMEARERIINGSASSVFCSSFSEESLTIWPTRRKGWDLILFNFVSPRDEMVVSGHTIEFGLDAEPLPNDDDEEISKWTVPLRFLTERRAN